MRLPFNSCRLSHRPSILASIVLALLLSGCQSLEGALERGRDKASRALFAPQDSDPPERAFAVPVWRDGENAKALLSQHAPVFLTEADWSAWNRIGTPQLYRDADDVLVARVDPTLPAIYAESREFTGASGTTYRNLIYRVHFERVPLRFKPLHISAGRNPGLFVVVTLNDRDEPLLYTTVHTCGCYLAMVPTSLLPAAARPENWAVDEQIVFEERLPGLLVASDDITPPDRRIALTLRDGTHRVAAIAFESMTQLRKDYRIEPTLLHSLASLDTLPVEGGGEASLFAEDGYVRNSSKPLELALVSWWALDKRVGQDKRLGRTRDDGSVFYTRLRKRDREESDMRDFGAFLAFHGWTF